MGRAVWAAVCIAGLCIAGAWGCAANQAGAPATAAPAMKEERREPASIEEAQAQLERARAQLAGGASVSPGTPAGGVTMESTPGAGGTTAAPEATSKLPDASGSRDRELQQPRCGNACGAMSSMMRAVDAICRMAGEADARCTDARKTLKDSVTKVAGCGCPAT